jgi:hypothetical protein
MLQLLTCSRGHFWESADAEATCPHCGEEAQSLPLLDLVQTEPPPAQPQPDGLPAELLDNRGRANVAGYDIAEDFGRGPTGMRLYRARHKLTGRTVLLEVVLAREDTTQHAWASLRSQAAALSRLPYPGIIQLYEVGERERQLFYNALEWVDGPTLRQKVADKPLPAAQIIHLGELLARTVDDAQAHGVLHRGLRPGAILLQPVTLSEKMPERDSPPAGICLLLTSSYYPRLSGYGLVRRATEGEAVDLGLYADEPGYISPEQAWGRVRDLGPHTDVWGLGGLLFFLVTGKAPFEGTPKEALERVQGEDITWPHNINRAGSELAAIIRKCLNRTPQRRYPSAGELADDLRRLSLGLPLSCQPDSAFYRFGKWLGKNPGLAGMVAIGVLGLAATGYAYLNGSGGSAAALAEVAHLKRDLDTASAEKKAAIADAESLRAQVRFASYQRLVAQIKDAMEKKQPFQAGQLMDAAPAELQASRGFEWVLLTEQVKNASGNRGRVALPPFVNDPLVARISPSGRYAAIVTPMRPGFGTPENVLSIWHIPGRAENLSLDGIQQFGGGRINDVAFSPDGGLVIAAGGGRREAGLVRAWTLAEDSKPRGKTVIQKHPVDSGVFTGVAIRPDGKEAALVTRDGEVVRLSLPDGAEGTTTGERGGGFGGTRAIALYSNDGRQAYTFVTGQRHVAVWALNGSRGRLFQYDFDNSPVAMALSRPMAGGEATLAVSLEDRTVRICDPERTTIREKLGPFAGRPVQLAFSPDGKRLAIAVDTPIAEARSVELYAFDGAKWQPIFDFKADARNGLTFSASGESLLTAGGRDVVVWGRAGN